MSAVIVAWGPPITLVLVSVVSVIVPLAPETADVAISAPFRLTCVFAPVAVDFLAMRMLAAVTSPLSCMNGPLFAMTARLDGVSIRNFS